MDYKNLFLGLSFSASVFSTFLCLILLGVKLARDVADVAVKKVLIVSLFFYAICIFFFSTTFFDVFSLLHIPYVAGLRFLSALLMPTLFYHFIFLLTRLKKVEQFNYFNYAISFLIGIVFYYYQEGTGEIIPVQFLEKIFFSFFVTYSDTLIASFYNIVYLLLSLSRLMQYRKNISNYSSNEEQDSLLWLYPIFVLGFLLLPGTMVLHIVPVVKDNLVFGQVIPNFFFMFFAISLCYNIFCENFALVTEDILEENITTTDLKKKKEKELFIDKQTFEQYIVNKKPYLNPQLKITDLLYDLMTNRSYLSQFINTTYKMNFSQYINHCRYLEYLALQASLGNTQKTQEDIVLSCGFRNYESFKRTQDFFSKNSGNSTS
ncbi:hypothetical protein [Myroides sp. WP-1]|uniref:hypothetical protein n=1 Tax=Myroides sp. WP-1 TaxID=2759944 RepID=UPI0015F9810E|nr:hypothetical protein [Myroides sp. WP-1]MBB1138863.1 hypothetical protein [Myroides sp. WP-1]